MIRHYLRQGEPKAIVARRFGVSRQTVYNHLKESVGETAEATPRPSKLDPYKEYLRSRLEKFDLPATVLLREIRDRGYAGGVTILKEFIRPIKNKKCKKLTERFETEPGRQAQVDWGECGLIDVQGTRRKLYVFVFVLGFSRMLFVKFTTSTRRHVLHQCLQEAFEQLGIPEEVLIDNMKQAVEAHTKEGVRYAREFLDFCEHYDVLPVATPPYWPRAKGKVERGVGYVKHSFLEGRSFTDLADLNRQVGHWLDSVANVRLHGTTGRIPAEAYLQERLRMRVYEAAPRFDTRPAEVRKVHLDAHIRLENVFYSVDPGAVGRSVVVKVAGGAVGDLIEVFLGDRVVATHRRPPQGTQRVTLPEHERRIRALTRAEGSIRGRQVQYTQLVVPEGLLVACPEVQTRSLELYEALLSTESLS
jgi:transposase